MRGKGLRGKSCPPEAMQLPSLHAPQLAPWHLPSAFLCRKGSRLLSPWTSAWTHTAGLGSPCPQQPKRPRLAVHRMRRRCRRCRNACVRRSFARGRPPSLRSSHGVQPNRPRPVVTRLVHLLVLITTRCRRCQNACVMLMPANWRQIGKDSSSAYLGRSPRRRSPRERSMSSRSWAP